MRKLAEDEVSLEGASFDGYRLLRLLGRGGAGEVYLAESPVDGPVAGQVALKLYRDARSAPVAHELMRQTQLAASLKHPHILPCYNNAIQGNDLGIVMAFAPGGSLGDTLNASNSNITLPLRPDIAARLVAQVARTLADIHAQGLAHGDLKPTNLFMRAAANGSPIVAISDFGHAFLAHAAVTAVHQQGSVPPEWAVEQLAWVAPEQLRGDPAPASDQYGLAALAYYLLTGIRPVSAEAQSVMSGNAPKSIIPPSRLNPALDDEIDAVLFHALAPLPRQRFGGVLDFARALDDALSVNDAWVGAGGMALLAGGPSTDWAESMADKPTKRTLAHMSYSTNATQTRRRPGAADVPQRPRPSRIQRLLRVSEGPTIAEKPQAWDGDDDARTSLRRRALPIAAVILVIGILGTLIVTVGLGNLRARLDPASLSGANGAPTAQSSPTPETAAQSQAESHLRAALGSKPVYLDTLTGNPATWAVNGKTIFFGPDHRLHLHNTAKTPLFADMPASASIPKGAYVATVDMTPIAGATDSHAGMRFLVSTAQKGDTYYSYLITADGRFELWLQQPETGLVFLTSGYAPALKSGTGQTNTLAVLVDPSAKTLTLFANGAFIFQAPIRGGVALTGRAGVLTPDNGVEAAFANFAIYSA